MRATQAEVWRFLAHLVDPASADDLTQEVYLRAIPAAARFRGEASARTWLLTIARRVAADEIRSRQRDRRTIRRYVTSRPDAHRESPASGAVAPDGAEEHALHTLIEALDGERRVAFVLTQLLGCSYAEAAEVCAVPIGTIRSRVARARGALARALSPTEQQDRTAR